MIKHTNHENPWFWQTESQAQANYLQHLQAFFEVHQRKPQIKHTHNDR
jgi:hypothetical protein